MADTDPNPELTSGGSATATPSFNLELDGKRPEADERPELKDLDDPREARSAILLFDCFHNNGWLKRY